MGILNKFAGGLLLASLCWATPASAQDGALAAEKLRRLDIMLMVTSLRCRGSEADFLGDYHRFAARHLDVMNNAGRQLQAHYSITHGAAGANRALDDISTGMANRYGRGHPWLECDDLRQVAQELAAVHSREDLLAAADHLLADHPAQRDTLVAGY